MKNFIFALVALIGLASSAYAQNSAVEAFVIYFNNANISLDTMPVASAGINGTNYIEDGGKYYFRAHADLGKAVMIDTKGKRIAISSSMPEVVMPEISRLNGMGVISNLSEKDFSEINESVWRMMVYSTNFVRIDTACCRVERDIKPLSFANESEEITIVNTHALPTQELLAPIAYGTTAAIAVPDGQVNAPSEVPDVLPIATPKIADGARQTNDVARSEAKIAGGVEQTAGGAQPQTPAFNLAEFIPILAGIAALVFAGIYVFSYRSPPAATIMEEAPEVRSAMSNETRVAIMNDLREAERIPTDLSTRLGKSKATIAEHLEQLMAAGLVEKVQTPGKKFVYYRLSQKGRTILLRRKMAA